MSQKIIMNEAKKQNPLPPSIQYMHGCCSSPGCPRLWRRKSALVLLLFGPRTHNKTHKLQFPPPLDALSSRDQKQRASLCPKPELSLTASPADQSQLPQRGTSAQRANEERGGKKGGQLIDLLLTFSHTLPRIGHFQGSQQKIKSNQIKFSLVNKTNVSLYVSLYEIITIKYDRENVKNKLLLYSYNLNAVNDSHK